MTNFFSSNLKFLREKSGKNQSDIALQVNKGHTTIGNWEKGNSEPSFTEIGIIANFFEISESQLLYQDLSKGKVIENANDVKNDEKGKGIGKGKGKLNALKQGVSEELQEPPAEYKKACKSCAEKDKRLELQDKYIATLEWQVKALNDRLEEAKHELDKIEKRKKAS